MHHLKLVVSQDHITNGKRGHSRMCPIALSTKEQMPGCSVIVSSNGIYVHLQEPFKFIGNSELPRAAAHFIKRFDAGLPVEPIEFEVDLT